ncbi:MAG: Kynurenine 3-monooxygenase [Phycisphaerae bacterium]|nr:Kynurenine 3-monooxygenase [Phycisphaerae bacterium]
MNASQKPRFVLIGGGLAGALETLYLGRAGYEVDLYERRHDPSGGPVAAGRSINLAISARGIDALQRVGLADEVLKAAIPMRGRMIHARDGSLHYQPYDKDPSRCINSVGRAALNDITVAAARRIPGVHVHFRQRCVDVNLDAPSARIVHEDTGEASQATGDILVGVDGAFSAVRRALMRQDGFDYSQSYLTHGYKELTIPPVTGGGHALECEALHIWPRRSFMMIALPNKDGSFTCTLFLHHRADTLQSAAGAPGFDTLSDDASVQAFFEREFRDALPLMPTLREDFHRNPTGSMMTVRCRPWSYRDKVLLLGDACHAVVPFYGQGANAAFEDCAVLDACIRRSAPDWSAVFRAYEAQRMRHTNALADLALSNFVEMRDKTASTAFRAYKRLERSMHRLMPWWYTPLYTLVSFTRTPYADAVDRARRQDKVLMLVFAAAVLLLIVLGWVVGGRVGQAA